MGLTQLQSIFGELIKKKFAKTAGVGLKKVLKPFLNVCRRTLYLSLCHIEIRLWKVSDEMVY